MNYFNRLDCEVLGPLYQSSTLLSLLSTAWLIEIPPPQRRQLESLHQASGAGHARSHSPSR